jgi:metal-responsive CopG/Arc/MetJ family transcriptional regulator
VNTVELPRELVEEIDAVAARTGVERIDIIREAVRDFLFFSRSRDLRTRMMAEAREQGLFTDEDVFRTKT